MKNKYLEINYENILKKYKLELISKLRDFGDNYLKLWVPDEEDTILSILNLIYSVNQSNYLNLVIKIKNNKELKSIDKLFGNFCNCKITLNDNFSKIVIDEIDEKKLLDYTKSYTNKQKKNKVIKKYNSLKISNNKTLFNNDFLKKNYFKKTKNIYFLINEKNFKKNHYDYIAKFKYYKLGIKLRKNIIDKVEFSSKIKNEFNIFLIEKFCKIIKKLPLQEAYEHGVIKLEYSLRPKSIYKKIQGIIPAYVLKNEFIICKKLINSIWKKYLIDNPNVNKNLYNLNPKKSWLKLDQSDKIKKINKSIQAFEKIIKIQNLIKFEKLNYHTKLTVGFNNKSKRYDKSTILLELEKFIRDKIDKRIEVFYKEVKDINKLRLSNLPKNFIDKDI